MRGWSILLALGITFHSTAARADECTAEVTGVLPGIVLGASHQCLDLRYRGTCGFVLDRSVPITGTLHADSGPGPTPVTVAARYSEGSCVRSEPGDPTFSLHVRSIEGEDIRPGHYQATLQQGEHQLRVRIRVFPAIAGDGHVTTTYAADLGFPRSTSGQSVAPEIEPIIQFDDADVDSAEEAAAVRPRVVNSVALTLPRDGDLESWRELGRAPAPDNVDDVEFTRLFWCVQSNRSNSVHPIDDTGYALGQGRPGVLPAEWRGGARMFLTSNRLRFAVDTDAEANHPVEVRLALVVAKYLASTRFQETADRRRDEHEICTGSGTTQILATQVVVSPPARRASVAIDIEPHMQLRCGGYVAELSGSVIAPLNHDIPHCRLHYAPPEACHLDPDDPGCQSLRYRGPQDVTVSVRGPDGQTIGDTWRFHIEDPSKPHSEPLGLESVPSSFSVEVSQPLGHDNARYRGVAEPEPGSAPAASTPGAAPPYAWRVRVRPRGTFGVSWPIRFFLTIPVAPIALRLPARAVDLNTSSTPATVSLGGPRTGAMVVAELWDYEQGRGIAGDFSFRAGVGMFLADVSSPQVFAPSFIAGISLSLPMNGTSQAGSAASLWIFYEHDFTEGLSHALVTLSIDVLSLGAGGTD